LTNFAPSNAFNGTMGGKQPAIRAGKRSDKGEDKRQAILDSAEALFAEHGFTGTSTRALAQHAGVNLGMLTYYFGAKEKIFEALIESRIIQVQFDFGNLRTPADYWRRSDDLVDLYVETFFSHPGYYRMLHREISLGNHPELRELAISLVLPNTRRVHDFIAKGIEAGVFRAVDVPLTIISLVGTIFQMLNSRCMSQRMLQVPETSDLYDAAVRSRLKAHLRDYLHTHLHR